MLPIYIYAQDTIYYNKQKEEVRDNGKADTYCVEYTPQDGKKYAIQQKCFYKSGNIKTEKYFKDLKKKKMEGAFIYYFENGNKKMESYYSKGKLEGVFSTFWEDGSLKRSDKYKRGKFKSGKVWDENGKEEDYYEYEIHAKFPGGKAAFQKYLKKNIRFPPGKFLNEEVRIKLRFKISPTGEVVEITILEGKYAELNAIAYQAIKNMPTWSPARQDGKYVTVKYTLPVVFAHPG